MIRSELIGKLVEAHPHLPLPVVQAALNAILNEIMDGLAQGKRVEVRGFGNFSSKVRDARVGRNPRTGNPCRWRTSGFCTSKLRNSSWNS